MQFKSVMIQIKGIGQLRVVVLISECERNAKLRPLNFDLNSNFLWKEPSFNLCKVDSTFQSIIKILKEDYSN